MIYLNLPVGGRTGWGVLGKSLAAAVADLTPARLITDALQPDSIADEIEFLHLQQLLPRDDIARQIAATGRTDGPLLQQAIQGLSPRLANIKGSRTVGYGVFEDPNLTPQQLQDAREHFDHLAVGSTWCAAALRGLGMGQWVSVVPHGIDPRVFFPSPLHEKQFLRDRFVVFSGGKFELRKGQDIVIRAVKVVQDRHRDVMLLCGWNNWWDVSVKTMSISPHLLFPAEPPGRDFPALIRQILSYNGIDLSRVILLGPRPQHTLARVYHNTDVGLFPNRCEGGTNLVLMEYMACGKPVIATAVTGHADVVTPDNALIIDCPRELSMCKDEGVAVKWPDPDIEQTIELLERAYQNREQLRSIADRAAADLAKMTWRHAAEQLLTLLQASA